MQIVVGLHMVSTRSYFKSTDVDGWDSTQQDGLNKKISNLGSQ